MLLINSSQGGAQMRLWKQDLATGWLCRNEAHDKRKVVRTFIGACGLIPFTPIHDSQTVYSLGYLEIEKVILE